MAGNALSTLPEGVRRIEQPGMARSGRERSHHPPRRDLQRSSLETLWMNGNSLTELPEAVFQDLSRLVDLNLGFNSLTALPEGVFDGLSALQALGLHQNSLMELPRGLFVELSGTPRQPARLDSLWLQGNRLRTLPEDVFRGLGNLRALLLNRNSLVALPEGVFRGLSHLQMLLLSDNSIASLPEGIFQGLSTGRVASGRQPLAALPPGLLDDTLSELGIGPENQGLHVDATLKARLGFAPAAQTANPGTGVTATVTLHRALPVSLRVPYAVGGTATAADYTDLSPAPEEGLLFPAGETRKEITLSSSRAPASGQDHRVYPGRALRNRPASIRRNGPQGSLPEGRDPAVRVSRPGHPHHYPDRPCRHRVERLLCPGHFECGRHERFLFHLRNDPDQPGSRRRWPSTTHIPPTWAAAAGRPRRWWPPGGRRSCPMPSSTCAAWASPFPAAGIASGRWR